ncbi:hypothetical protein [Cohnella rhizosphaerae]|uniref:Methyl-accepting chemotaxis protein n=1 Tax=Cohnella rhizosphaerae TaxID=1457232 RepID=A0A9X4KRY8_9BACL|nr:hypothetical protein [Cohnella rhizosphaerae]MDG0809453.1 hypothetical protein [Cohnella rhizosphaerae]
MRHFLHRSFYTKIQASFLILIFLPMVFISFISYSTTQGIVKDKIQLSNQSVLTVMAKDIEKMLDDIAYASNFFVQDKQALDPPPNVSDDQKHRQLAELRGLSAN